MLRNVTLANTLISLLVFVLNYHLVSAQTLVINYTDRGWYQQEGRREGITNYFVGDNGIEYRNFFVFNLSSVTQPIASATLELFVPAAGSAQGYVSADPSENYELHDVTTPIATLRDGAGGAAAFADLGSGYVFGSRTMTAADQGKVVAVSLNAAAISALDAATGLIGIGGSMTTLDGVPNLEGVFAGTSFDTDITRLRLTFVPEPSTLLLLGMGAVGLLGYGRKGR